MRVGVDTGGTFTDLVAEAGGELRVAKVPSTGDDPGRAVLEGLRELGLSGVPVVHGTTVATNALLERRGARVLFVTTPGFEDLAVIGRQDRPALYDPAPRRPAPLHVATAGADGDLPAAVRACGADAVAVCLLEAYRDPGGEDRVLEALRGAGVPVSLSSRVLREFREYERAATTLADAYVRPVVGRYIAHLSRAISPAPLAVMLSAGGVAAAERAAASPVLTVLSGPAGGVLGARDAALRAGVGRAIGFDMGGTSTDVSLVGATLATTTATVVGGVPIAVPALEVATVGAGGGSIARVDVGGALVVGPESAGAEPGPACYGRGGREATVTDAHVVLGHLDGSLAGGVALDAEAARRAVARIAGALGVAEVQVAAAILDVADAAMERPIRRLTVERGIDPRELCLVAFGGAGGLHAARLAPALGIRRVLLPVHPGLGSALGMLAAPRRSEASRTLFARPRDGVPAPEVERAAAQLAEEAAAKLHGEVESPTLVLACDMRFEGQSHEITILFGHDLEARFRAEHGRRHGFVLERPVELVTLRAVAEGACEPAALPAVGGELGGAPAGTRRTSLGPATSVWERSSLAAGARIEGPAIVVEMSATALVPIGWSATVLEKGDVLLERKA